MCESTANILALFLFRQLRKCGRRHESIGRSAAEKSGRDGHVVCRVQEENTLQIGECNRVVSACWLLSHCCVTLQAYAKEFVRPARVIEALEWLCQHSRLYQEEDILIKDNWSPLDDVDYSPDLYRSGPGEQSWRRRRR